MGTNTKDYTKAVEHREWAFSNTESDIRSTVGLFSLTESIVSKQKKCGKPNEEETLQRIELCPYPMSCPRQACTSLTLYTGGTAHLWVPPMHSKGRFDQERFW